MNIKLFTIMGLSWILEIASAIFPNIEQIWWITDLFNSLLGVCVFIIFVCKKRVLLMIKKKLRFKVHEDVGATRTMSTTASNKHRIVIVNKKL